MTGVEICGAALTYPCRYLRTSKTHIIQNDQDQDMTKKASNKRICSALIALCLCLQSAVAPISGGMGITAQAAQWTGYVKADRMNVRSGPGTTYTAVGVLSDNAQVTVLSETRGNDGYTWYQISYGNGSTGYARSDYIEQEVVYSASDSNFENWLNQQGFPESYKNGLRGLHQKYPNWVFVAQHTGLDWNTVITEESRVGRNLVSTSSLSSWKSTAAGAFDWAADSWPGFDGSAWVAASSEIIAHYMDPRNFLDEQYIFQFELQSYNSSTQTRDGLMQLISGTFLDNEVVVPVNGSSIDGGTVIENNGYGYADKSYGFSGGDPGSGNGGGSQSTVSGPGGSTGSTSGGPGGSYTFDSGYVNSGPGVGLSEASDISEEGSVFSRLAEGLFSLSGGITAYAAGWRKLSESPVQWIYEDESGQRLTSGWYWLDGNKDGVAECYYMDADGIMAADTTIDGYYINSDGKWVNTQGEPYTKAAETRAQSSAAGTTDVSEGPGAASGTGGTGGVSSVSGPGGTGSAVEAVSGTGTTGPGAGISSSGSSNGTSVSGPGTVSSDMGSSQGGNTDTTSEGSGQASSGQKYSEPMKLVSYADIIMKAAEQSGVSPYVIASMILQEQGTGTSDSISGSNSAYPGMYNYFNLGAYAHDGMGAVEAGLNYASQSGTGNRPWNTIEKSIIGGSILYGTNYVSAGQDTFYLKKFNVQGFNLYQHQYMTNVPAAASEGAKVASAYNDQIKATALTFKIPVYNNMPDTKCPMPTVDGSPNNKLSSITVDGYTLTPTFSMDTNDYSLIVDNAVTSLNVSASAINSRAKVSGTGLMNLNIGVNTVTITVTAENGTTRDYRISITRRDGAIGNVGGSESVVTTETGSASAGAVTGPGSVSSGNNTGSSVTTDNGNVSIGPGVSAGGSGGGGAQPAGNDSNIVVIGENPPGA